MLDQDFVVAGVLLDSLRILVLAWTDNVDALQYTPLPPPATHQQGIDLRDYC